MISTQIRQSFFDFFKSKQHTIVPSSSLKPDSPTSCSSRCSGNGMNQFVPIFLGQTKCPNTPDFVLQETWVLSPANWTNSPSGATNPITVSTTLPTKFYRLFKP